MSELRDEIPCGSCIPDFRLTVAAVRGQRYVEGMRLHNFTGYREIFCDNFLM